jgi:phosphoglycolate phosphatase-like HAD superfamily hydrolase
MDRLVIFDVDGTLCNTTGVDDGCFRAAASALLGIPAQLSTWQDAPHITDLGIVEWLWTRHLGRLPTPQEIDAFGAQFEAALRGELQRAPERFAAILGASQLLARLEREERRFAFATGGWGKTARLKLQAAGLPVAPLLGSSDDSRDRLEIFSLAATRAATLWGTPPGQVVLVGDGTWDVRVAARLGWPFVGVGRGDRAARLRDEGANLVIPDFADCDGTLAAILEC